MAKREFRRRDEMQRLLEEWRTSGLTQKAFCLERGVPPTTFNWWKHVLSRSALARPTSLPPSKPAAAAFVEVAIPRTSSPTSAFELVLPNRVVVRVPSAFDGDALRRLLDVVGR